MLNLPVIRCTQRCLANSSVTTARFAKSKPVNFIDEFTHEIRSSEPRELATIGKFWAEMWTMGGHYLCYLAPLMMLSSWSRSSTTLAGTENDSKRTPEEHSIEFLWSRASDLVNRGHDHASAKSKMCGKIRTRTEFSKTFSDGSERLCRTQRAPV